MITGPLISWLAEIDPVRTPAARAARVLAARVADQGVHLLVTEDPWFVRARVEEAQARLTHEWRAAHPDGDPIPEGWLPIFRQGADPAFGMRRTLSILGVIPDMPLTLLTTNVAVEFDGTTVRALIETQRLWSDDPARDRRGIAAALDSAHPAADAEAFRIVHCGTMWVTPGLRGRRPDGVPLATHLAPLLRLAAEIHLFPDLIISTVADRRLTRTVRGRVDGEILVTEAGTTARQALHIYDADDRARAAAEVLAGGPTSGA